MSRTYRKTSIRHGKPKYHTSKFSQYQEDVKHIEPELMKETRKKKERKTVTRVEEYCRWNPKHAERRIYVPKGTPLAQKEIQDDYPYYPTGKWYLIPPPWEITFNYKERIYTRWDRLNWAEWSRQYNHLWVFRHVHLNKTGARRSNAHRFNKRERVRRLRLEGKDYIRNWEDEYDLNQHLEPFNWMLDDDFGIFDLIDEMDSDYEEWHDYADTEDYPDDDYDYEPWGDDLVWYWDYD